MRYSELIEQSNDTGLRAGPPYPQEDMDKVKQMQSRLEDLGYSVGTTGIDGKYGPRTSRAVRAFKRDFGLQGSGSSMSAEDLQTLSTAKKKERPSDTGNHSSGRGGADTIDFATGESSGRVMQRQSSMARTRKGPIDDRLERVLERAAEAAGVDVVVFSGGQPSRGSGGARTGSIRHDDGMAADIYIYNKGRRLRTDREDPIVAKFIAAAVAAGAKGIGAGPGYMSGVGIHVDLWGDRAGSNTWGRGGRSANTPSYVSAAYQAGRTGSVA